ncbi:MAG: HAMP domain-containing protein, partial [Candidatus Hydrogenedentes bacterium]|nr:HAMP domain-containing protein [Candidatus Hydrogenedentota bacterium]
MAHNDYLQAFCEAGVFGGALLVFSRITKPVNKLVLATERAAQGDLSARVEVVSSDEIGLLGAAFNEMIANREAAERALLLSEEEQRRLADANAANATIGRIVSSSLDIREVYDAFVQEVHTLVRFDWVAISILDRDMKTQRIDYVSDEAIPLLQRGTSLPL